MLYLVCVCLFVMTNAFVAFVVVATAPSAAAAFDLIGFSTSYREEELNGS